MDRGGQWVILEGMFALFRLLFSRAYWRTLFHPETWRQGRVSLRRLHKDARARKQFRRLLFLIAVPFFCVAYLIWAASVAGGLIGIGLVLVVFLLVALYRRYRPAEDGAPMTLSLTKREEPKLEPPPEVTPALRKEFAEMALVCAVLVDRAGSESFLKTKELPEGFEVVTRQRHMEILREYGLYERLGSQELDLMLLPDGHWEPGVIDQVSMQLEPLRLFRWVLRVDNFLPTVGATMQADYRLAGTVVKQPQMLFEGTETVSIDSIRTGITAADHYFFRCWAEGLRRGLYTGDDSDDANRAREYAEKMHGKEGADLLLGTTIVSKAEDADVRLGATLGLRRLRILGWVKQRMYGEVEAMEKLTQIG